jgi:hypothetical protein
MGFLDVSNHELCGARGAVRDDIAGSEVADQVWVESIQ